MFAIGMGTCNTAGPNYGPECVETQCEYALVWCQLPAAARKLGT